MKKKAWSTTLLGFCFSISLHFPNFAVSSTNFYQKALVEASAKNFSQAIEHLNAQISNDSSFTEAYLRLADFYKYSGRFDDGINFFQDKISEHPQNPNYSLALAHLYTLVEDWHKVFEHCQAGLTAGSDSRYLIDLLVTSAIKTKKTVGLRGLLNKAKKDSIQKPLYDLGYAIWRNLINSKTRAQSSISAYLSVETDYYGYRVQGDIDRTANKFPKAISGYKTALTLSNTGLQRIAVLAKLAGIYQITAVRPDSTHYYFSAAKQTAREETLLKELLELCVASARFYKKINMFQKLADTCHEGIKIAWAIDETEVLENLYRELGFAYEKMDDMDRALKYHTHALMRGRKNESKSTEANALYAIGRIYHKQGRIDSALIYVDKSMAISRRSRDWDIHYQAQLIAADIYKKQGNTSEAKSAYLKVLRYAQRVQQHDLTETCFVRLANLYLDSETPEMNSATYYFNLADALARQTFQLQFAANHRWLEGRQALMQNDIEKAETLFQEAIQLGEESGSFFSIVAGQAGLVRTYLAANIPELAAAYSDSVLNSVSEFFERSSPESTVEFFDLTKDLFEPVITALSAVGNLEKIYHATELYKALIHIKNFSKAKYRIRTAVADSIKWKIDLYNQKIEAKWNELWQMWDRDRNDHLELVTAYKKEISELVKEKDKELLEIKQRFRRQYHMLYPKAESLRNLQTNLRQMNATFVHYFVGDSATFITVISPNDIACRRVNVTQEYLNNLVRQISPMLTSKGLQGLPGFESSLFRLDLAGLIYETLFVPIRDLIANQSLVIISTDKILGKFPFEAMVTNQKDLTDIYDYNYAHFLLEDLVITYTPYASLVNLPIANKSAENKKTLLAFGHSEVKSHNSLVENQSNGKANSKKDNLKKITPSFGRPEVQLYTGESATKERYLMESPKYQIIHLNLPHSLEDRFPLYSKIEFAAPHDAEENHLETHEILNQSLNTDLVVLSGNANTETGANAFFHAFNFAGVPSVITSLWTAETPELFETFYLNLKMGMGKADALQKAKVTYMQTVSANPLHWATFVLNGNPDAITFKSNTKYWIIYITIIAVAIFLTAVIRQFLKIRNEQPG